MSKAALGARTRTMPLSMQRALEEFGLMQAYALRPPDEQSAWERWIKHAGAEPEERERLAQLLDNLDKFIITTRLA
jgi:hypothetical protein